MRRQIFDRGDRLVFVEIVQVLVGIGPVMKALPQNVSVVIVGGGVQGLSCAVNLALLGVSGIMVLDAGYWQGGASGRNGTLIRPGFGGPEWTRLFELSWREWTTLSKKLGHNIMFTERGYTMVAETAKTAMMLEGASRVHKQFNIKSDVLSQADVARILPAIEQKYVSLALHQPRAGVAPHHAVMKGYLKACEERGIDVRYRTRVTGFEKQNGRVVGVHVGDQLIRSDVVVVAGGPHNSDLARLAGADLNGYMLRIEAMALEPIRPLLVPAVALIDSLAYFHQTGRGEFVGGTEIPEKPQENLRSDVPSIAAMARVYVRMMPQLAELRILRQWAGFMHISSDFAPMLGEHPGVENLWFSAGWSYGFAGAPAGGLVLAKAIAKGQIDEAMKPFTLDRFERKKPVIDAGIMMANFD